jgi:hypothetical protein
MTTDYSRYSNQGDRDSEAVDAARQYQVGVRARRRTNRRPVATARGIRLVTNADVTHGFASTYTNWYCRCIPCTEAYSDYYYRRRV